MISRVSLIGAPSDIGAGTRGASMGPKALRVARIQFVLESQGVEVRDRGDLRGPANPPGRSSRRLLPSRGSDPVESCGAQRRALRPRRLTSADIARRRPIV